jgi:hypothetical protein
MKRHTSEEIIEKLGLKTRRPGERNLLLILTRLQSEDLVGEERQFVLNELFSQHLEVLRLRSGVKGRFASHGFQLHQAELTIEWISRQDSTIDGLNEILELLQASDLEAIRGLTKELIEHEHRRLSNEQSRRAKTPRKLDPFNQIIFDELVKRWPEWLSEPDLMRILKSMERRSIVRCVGPAYIELDDRDTGYTKDIPISGIRRRLTEMRKRIEAEKSRDPARVN